MASFRAVSKLLSVLGALLFSLSTLAAALEPADEHGSCPEWSYSGGLWSAVSELAPTDAVAGSTAATGLAYESGEKRSLIEQTVNIHLVPGAEKDHAVRNRGKNKRHRASRLIPSRVLV